MILVVDDDGAVRSSLRLLLKRAGYEVETVESPDEAMGVVRNVAPELILLDMNFTRSTSGAEGLTLLKQIKIFQPSVPVMLMTAWGSIPLAVEGIKAGAMDFISKPWDNRVLLEHIATALELSKSNGGNVAKGFDRSNIIGHSKPLTDVLATIERVACTNASVLIMGENGTGKELIAEALHRNSRRSAKPFVKVNLGGISQSLFESEMFGHKKGAFTGASADRVGRFELADGGTIFLDEIGDLDMSCQVKLLRVLQEQTFEPLGDSRPRRVDVRVVCATNADLPRMVAERKFREDLFYRINLITVTLPSLRERRDDIPLLVRHFADKVCKSSGMQPTDFTPAAMAYLSRLPYPGNIRELKNLVERTLLVEGKRLLDASDFEAQYQRVEPRETATVEGLTLDELERRRILAALAKHGRNMSAVAVELGISRQSLYRRLEKYGIEQP